MTADTLLIGAGDLGTEIGLRLAAAGRGVVAVRRRAELVPAPLVGVAGDVSDGLPDLREFDGPGDGPRLLTVCLTAGGRSEERYRALFLDGVNAVLRDLAVRGWTPERAIFVSSTGAMRHAQTDDAWVDETSTDAADTPTGRVLAEAEQSFLAGLPVGTRGIVVRPSGLYGPGREWFIDQVRAGKLTDPDRMTNRIHRDDAAAAVVHLLTMSAEPDELYLLTDDAPAPAREVATFLAGELGIDTDPFSGQDAQAEPSPTRRLSNARLRGTGFTLTYPTFREGYASILSGEGERHP